MPEAMLAELAKWSVGGRGAKNYFAKKFFPQTPFSKNFTCLERTRNLELCCCKTLRKEGSKKQWLLFLNCHTLLRRF
jgi:hypothetical protein